MVLLASVAVVLAFLLVARRQSDHYRAAAGVALLGHLLLAVVVLPYLPYDWDVDVFHEVAVSILQGAETSPLSPLDAFGTFQAVVYASFGSDPTTLAIVNGFLAILIPIPACYVAQRLYDPLGSTNGLLVVALYLPLPFLFSSLPMRDALSTLLALTLLALLVRVVAERRHWWSLAIPPLWGMLFLLREELALLVVLGAAGAAFVDGLRWTTDWNLTLASLSLGAVPIGVTGFGLFALLFPIEALNARLAYRASGGATYLGSMQYESWLDVLLAAPIRAIYFQFAPFPLHVDSAFDLVSAASLPILIVLATSAYLSLRTVDADLAVAFPLLIVYVGGIVGYGLIDSNFGTTIRHRTVFVLLLAIFSAPVLESWYDSLLQRVEEASRQPRETGEQQSEAEKLHPGSEVGAKH